VTRTARRDRVRAPQRADRPHRRAWTGRLLGPPAAFVTYLLLPGGPDGLTDPGRAAAAVGLLMAILWMTEALPLAATALLPLALFPVLGVAPIEDAAAPYANPIIFLFLGGFLLALSLQRWGLDRRIALQTLRLVGMRRRRLVGGFMVATALLSMWVSNTATAMMMVPIGISVLALLESEGEEADERRLGTVLLLAIAYAASIGSVATPVGTPPNLLLAAFAKQTYGIDIGFLSWMAVGLPAAAGLIFVAWLLLTRVLHRLDDREVVGGRALIARELAGLGGLSRGERTVLVVFAATASAWVLREPLTGWSWLVERVPAVAGVTDAGIAITAALVLFAVPVDVRRGVFALRWEAVRELPWEILLLFGGGLSLAGALQTTGVDVWLGERLAVLGAIPFPLFLLAVTLLVITLTELTSNTATAATMLPLLAGVAASLEVAPLALLVPAVIAASWAFMLPVATPPNAIAFASGHVTVPQMARTGLWLNLVGAALITAIGLWLVPLLLSG
jgi:solute carrier family 13 (sodium-dependent dicarboxylate transporter), member 2/3/5